MNGTKLKKVLFYPCKNESDSNATILILNTIHSLHQKPLALCPSLVKIGSG